jgi:hypothetical protein
MSNPLSPSNQRPVRPYTIPGYGAVSVDREAGNKQVDENGRPVLRLIQGDLAKDIAPRLVDSRKSALMHLGIGAVATLAVMGTYIGLKHASPPPTHQQQVELQRQYDRSGTVIGNDSNGNPVVRTDNPSAPVVTIGNESFPGPAPTLPQGSGHAGKPTG